MKALLALVTALAAITCAAPIASMAATPQGYRFITDTLAPGNGSASAVPQQGYRFITDTLAPGGGSASAVPKQGYRFITDTLAQGGGSTIAIAAPSTGFSWADAGIGAGAGIGALLLLTGGTVVVLQRRGRLAV